MQSIRNIKLGSIPLYLIVGFFIIQLLIYLNAGAIEEWIYLNTSIDTKSVANALFMLGVMLRVFIVQVLLVIVAMIGPGVAYRRLSVAAALAALGVEAAVFFVFNR